MAGLNNVAGYSVYKNLASLNEAPDREAEQAFLDCCGSTEWARLMTERRPYPMLNDLFQAARSTWFKLSRGDWLEAFAAHPKIGEKKAAKGRGRAAKWSCGEQSGVAKADSSALAELAEANLLYEQKFGFIFIICASGRDASEILAICKARSRNSVETELQIAAEEQAKITELRLEKLLER